MTKRIPKSSSRKAKTGQFVELGTRYRRDVVVTKNAARVLVTSQERELDYWTREFGALHARMQTHKARGAVDALFSATDADLNRRNA